VNITATGVQGHASMPSGGGAIGALATALARLTATPQPGELIGPIKDSMAFLAPHARLFPFGIVYANAWLTSTILKSSMSASPNTDALLRTTTAITVLRAGKEKHLWGKSLTDGRSGINIIFRSKVNIRDEMH